MKSLIIYCIGIIIIILAINFFSPLNSSYHFSNLKVIQFELEKTIDSINK
jgi:hypothetical protein